MGKIFSNRIFKTSESRITFPEALSKAQEMMGTDPFPTATQAQGWAPFLLTLRSLGTGWQHGQGAFISCLIRSAARRGSK